MREFTVIIPTWNMGRFLEPLFNSILRSDFAAIVEEVIFVCEKSNDGSEAVIEKLRLSQGDRLPRVKMLQPNERKGLFVARYLGAKSAQTKKILFIDSRITLPAASGKALATLGLKYPAMIANVDIDIGKNIYCLYWQRSHETIFRSTFKKNLGIVHVSEENFKTHRIGGTCFYCSRDLFVNVSERYMDSPLISDDTYLMADMVKVEPFTVHPEFRVNWEPRDTAKVFLKHLYTRGPGFAQYNIFHTRGLLFYLTMSGLAFLILFAALLVAKPLWGLTLLAAGLLALLLSTALFVKSIGEFFRLAPLHAGVILAYGFGALRGIWILWKTNARMRPKDDPILQK